MIAKTNGYDCSDGCYIDDGWVNDGWCDCTDCGDESSWSCATCDCPDDCETYNECDGTGGTGGYVTTIPSHDYYFRPNSTVNSSIEAFGCTFAGCSVAKTWYIVGQCSNPKLSVWIVETDFDSSWYEYATVYVNDVGIGTCSNLNGSCTEEVVACSNAYKYGLSDDLYSPSSSSRELITIGVSITSDVNTCPYSLYGSDYYLLTVVQIVCNTASGMY